MFDRVFCFGGGFCRDFRAIGNAFGKHELDISDTDKAQEQLDVRSQQVRSGIFVNATTAGQTHGALAFDQAFRAGFGLTEGHASTGDQVEIVLQLRRNVEVVHWGSNHHHIMCLQLCNQRIRQ